MFIKGVIDYVKANRNIVVIGVIAIAVACYFMFSGGIPNNGSGLDKARAELGTAREQLDLANKQLSDSQAIASDLQRTNNSLTDEIAESRRIIDKVGQANNDIAAEIERGANINQSNLDLVRECQQILKPVRKTGQTGNP